MQYEHGVHFFFGALRSPYGEVGCGNEFIFRPISVPAVRFELLLLYGSRGGGLDEPQKVITGTAFVNMSSETSNGRDTMLSPVVVTVHSTLPNTGQCLRKQNKTKSWEVGFLLDNPLACQFQCKLPRASQYHGRWSNLMLSKYIS